MDRNNRLIVDIYTALMREFAAQEVNGDTTLRLLAKRIGRTDAQIKALLAAPSRWTLSDVSDLALGLGVEVRFDMFDNGPRTD